MELLSYGANMRVIEPASLMDEIKEALSEALNRYK